MRLKCHFCTQTLRTTHYSLSLAEEGYWGTFLSIGLLVGDHADLGGEIAGHLYKGLGLRGIGGIDHDGATAVSTLADSQVPGPPAISSRSSTRWSPM